MKAHPDLVPFRDEWLDNLGGMANAIYWLDANWPHQIMANGDRLLPDGTRWVWSYSPITGMLIVFETGTKQQWCIETTKLVKGSSPDDAHAPIYRPYPDRSGLIPKVTWLNTRRTEVIKSHHLERCPLTVGQANSNMHMIFKRNTMGQFPDILLSGLLTEVPSKVAKKYGTDGLTKAYVELYQHVMMLGDIQHAFLDFHWHSYKALKQLIIQFNQAVHPDWRLEDIEQHVKQGLFNETQRLAKAGASMSATITDSLCYDRAPRMGVKAVLMMTDANCGAANHQRIEVEAYLRSDPEETPHD